MKTKKTWRKAKVTLGISWDGKLCMNFISKKGNELGVTFSDANPPEDVQRYLEKYYLKQEGRYWKYWIGKVKLSVKKNDLKITFTNDKGGKFILTVLKPPFFAMTTEEFKRYIEKEYLR